MIHVTVLYSSMYFDLPLDCDLCVSSLLIQYEDRTALEPCITSHMHPQAVQPGSCERVAELPVTVFTSITVRTSVSQGVQVLSQQLGGVRCNEIRLK